eukprot:5428493-Ditylum_brightwellii.AAC.1
MEPNVTRSTRIATSSRGTSLQKSTSLHFFLFMRTLSTLPMIHVDYCPPIMERQLPASEMGQLATGTSE